MKYLIIAIYTMCVTIATAQVLRLSLVDQTGDDNAEKFSIRENGIERVFAVSKDIILTEKDVASAGPVLHPNRLALVLTEKGAGLLSAKLKQVKIGEDRLAIIVQDKLVSAAIIEGPLGKSFEVSGLDGNDLAATQKLADLIMGLHTPEAESVKSGKQVAKPYTDEEYQQLKLARQKRGQFYIDKIPTEVELKKNLTVGLTVDQVKGIYGTPTRQSVTVGGGTFQIEYELAPERLPIHADGEMVSNIVAIMFEDNLLHSWHINTTSAFLSLNVDKNQPSTLKMLAPALGEYRGEGKLLLYLEKIKILDIEQKVNQQDLHRLLSLIITVNQSTGSGNQGASVSTECDVLKFLCYHYKQMAQLVATNKEGRVPIVDLSALAEKLLIEAK